MVCAGPVDTVELRAWGLLQLLMPASAHGSAGEGEKRRIASERVNATGAGNLVALANSKSTVSTGK